MELEKIIKVIDEKRIELGMSKKQLAEKANVTYRAILFWERGERVISLENVIKLLNAVGLRLEIKQQSNE